MPRQKRIAKGNIVYHVLNRANGRLRIFKKSDDFETFDAAETCIHRSRPFGDAKWTQKTAVKLSLESSLRPTGRPKKEAEK